MASFVKFTEETIQNLQQCLESRFDDFQTEKLAFLKLLDIGAWPGELEELKEAW
jgi:hypothetical protein